LQAPPKEMAILARGSGTSGAASVLAFGISVAGVMLLATRIYFVEELVVFLIALAVLFALGAGFVLLAIVFHEVVRWSFGQIVGVKERSSLPRENAHIPSPNVIQQHGH
jgi:hypothetical protein